MHGFPRPSLIAATFLAAFCAAQHAGATVAPSDPCSLLTTTDLSTATGQNYATPTKTTAPRPYRNTVEGTDCHYEPSGKGSPLLFRIYFDNSPDEATGLFAKLKMFYSPPTPVSGIGDDTYLDPRHAIHARKGNVRYFLQLGDMDTGTSAKEQQLQALATLIAKRL
jgi:hypothetical protein